MNFEGGFRHYKKIFRPNGVEIVIARLKSSFHIITPKSINFLMFDLIDNAQIHQIPSAAQLINFPQLQNPQLLQSSSRITPIFQ